MPREELRELALNIATANGLMRVLLYSGKNYTDAEAGFQQAVREFDAALDRLYAGYRCSRCGDCLFDDALESANEKLSDR